MGEAKLSLSMSPNNAAYEGFFGRLKMELFYPGRWQDTTIEQFIQVIDSHIRWHNEKRIKISLDSLSPIEYRDSLGFSTQTNPSFALQPSLGFLFNQSEFLSAPPVSQNSVGTNSLGS